jgi:hypothetical protein
MKGEKMECFKKIFGLLIISTLVMTAFAQQQPSVNFEQLLIKAERNPQVRLDAYRLAGSQNLPVLIYLASGEIIQALDIENGKVVYGVITNHAHPFLNGRTSFYDELVSSYDLWVGRTHYEDDLIFDNIGGVSGTGVSERTTGLLLLVPDWTDDKVIAFDAQTGDLVDPSFIPPSNPLLQSPKQALQSPWGTILVSDQISDVVQEFDTAGTYIRIFAPAGGVNTAILDNIRGISFRPNYNLLVTVGSGASQNTCQHFSTSGTHIGTFITGITSPFDILFRTGDILVDGSSAPDINQYDTLGTFLSTFHNSSSLTFCQQMLQLPNGDIAVAGFSSPSGIIILSSTGTYIRTLSGVSGCRGVYQLPNGNFLATNAAGIHEIDDTTGTLIRTILTGANFQYIDIYDPNLVVSNSNISGTLPKEYRLYENYPNPFNPSTTIKFTIPENGFVTLSVFDVTGREVGTLINSQMNPGTHEISFDASSLASGMYFYKIIVNNFTDVKKMVLIK